MKKSLLSKLTNNLALKIISVIIAIVIWYAVVKTDDPVETTSYAVQVEVLNESYIANGKQSYTIDDEYRTVTVYITDNRSILQGITSDDISVTADLTQIVDLERDPVMVPLDVSCPDTDKDNVTLSRTTIPIVIEDIDNLEFPIVVDTQNTTPNKNYEVGTLTPSVDKITISGPKSLVSSIDTVLARVDVSSMSTSGDRKAKIVLLDKDQNEMQESTLSALSFSKDVDDIYVTVDLWKVLSGIKLKASCSGTPASGYQVAGITVLPSEITLVGDENAEKTLEDQNDTLQIPAELLNAEGASEDFETQVDLKELLSDHMRLSSNTNEQATVYVTILPDNSKEFTLDVDEIDLAGLASDLTVSYEQTSIAVKVEGTTSSISDLKASEIKASINLQGKTAGDYEVPVDITLPNGYVLVEETNITVHVKEKAETLESTEEAPAS